MSLSFSELSLSTSILTALKEEGYTTPTPIQVGAIPKVLAGKDLIATAQTGTGKTAAFLLPILHLLENKKRTHKGLRALVLTPTRELALQIAENGENYSRHQNLKTTVVIGGVPIERQIRALSSGTDILIATPGRLLDLINQIRLPLDGIEVVVLDEADRMLDMGFIRDVRKILALLPKKRQSLLFSATMSKEIIALSNSFLVNPDHVEVAPPASISTRIKQSVLFVDAGNKTKLLEELLLKERTERTLIFTRTKHKANRIAEQISKLGIPAEAIHSNKSQNARQRALDGFHSGKVKVLIATDIVARGIDVDNITLVINFELPDDIESYVHRIGRTARAGTKGEAISFCSSEELSLLKQIEKLISSPIDIREDHPLHSKEVARLYQANIIPAKKKPSPAPRGNGNRQGPSRGRGGNNRTPKSRNKQYQ
jgi:ATP-dependent RNA helicase RhlE